MDEPILSDIQKSCLKVLARKGSVLMSAAEIAGRLGVAPTKIGSPLAILKKRGVIIMRLIPVVPIKYTSGRWNMYGEDIFVTKKPHYCLKVNRSVCSKLVAERFDVAKEALEKTKDMTPVEQRDLLKEQRNETEKR